jgi:hypothetical protein
LESIVMFGPRAVEADLHAQIAVANSSKPLQTLPPQQHSVGQDGRLEAA